MGQGLAVGLPPTILGCIQVCNCVHLFLVNEETCWGPLNWTSLPQLQ